MIIKKRDEPMKLYALEALHRRLPVQYSVREKVFSDLVKEKSGLRGEKEVDFALRFLNKQQYLIFHNVRLEDEFGAFQLDSLILSSRFMLILEVKNWYGKVIFGENGQVTRIGDDGDEEGFSNPVAQAQLQQHRLSLWLQARGFPSIPIHFLVVISFPSTIIKSYSADHPIPRSVIHTNQILHRIHGLEKFNRRELFKMKQIQLLSNFLIKGHTSPKLNVIDHYNIRKEDLIKGVFCPNCSHAPLIRHKQKWVCIKCESISIYGHLTAFNDYMLLIDMEVSNKEMRRFLKISSASTMKYLLQKEGFEPVGQNRGRKYKLKWTPS